MPNIRPQILMVDDDEADAFFVRKAFERAGIDADFTHALGGVEFFAFLDQRGGEARRGGVPRVVLLDINMPAMSGFDVLGRLRMERAGDQMPVVMLTTSTSPDDITRAYRDGASSYIVKPNSVQAMQDLAKGFADYWFKLARLPGEGG